MSKLIFLMILLPFTVCGQTGKFDSIQQTSYKAYQKKLDSLNTSTYVQQLEKSLEIQNGNYTFYSVPIAAMALVVGVLAIMFTFNFFAERRSHHRRMRDLIDRHNNFVQTQSQTFEQTMERKQKTFLELETKFNAAIEGLVNQAQKEIDERLKGKNDKDKEIVQELEEIKQNYNQLRETIFNRPVGLPAVKAHEGSIFSERSIKIICKSCQKSFSATYVPIAIIANDSGLLLATCPYCNTDNKIVAPI